MVIKQTILSKLTTNYYQYNIGDGEIEIILWASSFLFAMSGNYKYLMLGNNILKGEFIMSVEAYAGFAYLFTAAIALFMIGAVVLLNKLMGGSSNSNGEGMN